jgi:PAS domain S-box-containing protein
MQVQTASVIIFGPPTAERLAVEQALYNSGPSVHSEDHFEPSQHTHRASLLIFDASSATELALAACLEAAESDPIGSLPRIVIVRAALRSAAFAAGATDVILTPIVPAEVRARVASHLERAALDQSVLKHIDQAIMMTRDGCVIDCNPAAERMFGGTREQLLGKRPTDFSPDHQPDGQPSDAHVDEHLQRAAREGLIHFEGQRRRLDGTHFTAAIKLTPIPHSPGLLIAIIEDVTERRATQAKLAAANELHGTVLAHITDAVFITDDRGRLTYVCPNVSNSFGISHSEALAVGHVDGLLGLLPIDPDQLAQTDGLHNVEHVLQSPTGPVTLLINVQPVQIGEGTRLYTCRDISRRRAVENILERHRQQLASIIKAFQDIIYVADMDTHEVLLASPSLTDRLGLDPVGQRCYEVFQGLDAPCSFCTNDIIRANPEVPHVWEHHNRHLGRDYLTSDQIIEWPDGRQVRFEVAIDITERKLTQQRLAQAQRLAKLGTWVLDFASQQIWWSEESYRIFGQPETFKPDYRAVLACFHPDDQAWVEANTAAMLAAHSPIDITHRIVRPDGTVRHVIERATFKFDDHGAPITLAGTVQDVTEQVQTARRLHQALVSTIQAIGRAMDKRDPYTAQHQDRVAHLSVAIARRLGFNEDRIEGLRLGASIHDIGKIYVPSDILNRPRRLSEVEFALVKEHCVVGEDIMAGIEFPWPMAAMIRQHHERMDGSGYPDGLEGDAITLEARIIAVADVVEAMATHRPYRASLGLPVALAEIRKNRGRLYDPGVVDACLAVMDDGFSWMSSPA